MTTPDDPTTPYHDARDSKQRFAKQPKKQADEQPKASSNGATLYAAVDFKDATGHHEAGTVINLPSDTPEQQVEIDTMLRYGVLTKTKPKT